MRQELILRAVAIASDLTPDLITSAVRSDHVACARHVYYLLLRDVLGWSVTEIAERHGVAVSTVSYAIGRAEWTSTYDRRAMRIVREARAHLDGHYGNPTKTV